MKRITVAVLIAGAIALAACGQPAAQNPPPAPGYVGVQLATMTPEQAKAYGLTGSAVVAAAVAPDGPAYQSGLRDDDAVTSIDGQRVTDSAAAASLVLAHKAGDKIRMGIVHLMGDGRRVEIELGIVAAPRPEGYGNASTDNSGGQRGAATTSRNTGGLRVVDPQKLIEGLPIHQGFCSAIAPQGWKMITTQTADAMDLQDATGRLNVGWGIRGVNMAMQQAYGQMYGPPEVAVLAPIALGTRSNVDYTGPETTVGGYFTARPFKAGNMVGTVLYHVYPMYPPMPGQYILSSFYAYVDQSVANMLPTAVAVMLTVSCQTQLRPVEPSRPPGGSGGSKRTGSRESDSLKDYNKELGTQWAHSSSGKNYQLDRATMWNDNGPDGPGYYIKYGNTTEKLTPGWGG